MNKISKIIEVPELGDGVECATVACVHVQPGSVVQAEDELLELVTDKASFCIEAPCHGVVSEVRCEKGVDVAIGATVVVLEVDC